MPSQNNGCYAWNWRECFDRSIHSSVNWAQTALGAFPTPSPEIKTAVPTEVLFPEDNETEQVMEWSMPQSAMKGSVLWKWSLADLETPSPQLFVEISATNVHSDEYVAFGVAEHLMQGALVVCSEQTGTVSTSRATLPSSRCVTFLGDGMGITRPRQDPVNPRVIFSFRNGTHYTVRFSGSLFGCWAHPRLPARVLLAKGRVSGDGVPEPHLNDGQHREAVKGIEFLSVVKDYIDGQVTLTPTASLKPLPAKELWKPAEGSVSGSGTVLEGRVTVEYGLYHHSGSEIISVNLNNVNFASMETYVAFGFASHVMSGLVISCAPRTGTSRNDVTAKCQQWRGQGTNLIPLDTRSDAGGWFLTGVASNSTHFNYTFAGRVHDVINMDEADGMSLLGTDGGRSLRAICAIGRSAADSGTPLIHNAGDRVGFSLRFGPDFESLSSAPVTFGKTYVKAAIAMYASTLFLFI